MNRREPGVALAQPGLTGQICSALARIQLPLGCPPDGTKRAAIDWARPNEWRELELQHQVNDKDEGRYERNRKEKAREYERQRAVGSKISLSASFRLNANGSRHHAQNKLKQTGWTAFRVLI